MNKQHRSRALVVLGIVLMAAFAVAATLEQLRKDGSVGERYDGFVALRSKDTSAEIKDLIDGINAKRRALYQKDAQDEGVPVDQVGRVYAKQLYDEAASGTWFLTEDDGWLQKP